MHIVLTYYSDVSGTPQVHIARNAGDMARLWRREWGSGREIKIFEVPEHGDIREVTERDPAQTEVT